MCCIGGVSGGTHEADGARGQGGDAGAGAR